MDTTAWTRSDRELDGPFFDLRQPTGDVTEVPVKLLKPSARQEVDPGRRSNRWCGFPCHIQYFRLLHQRIASHAEFVSQGTDLVCQLCRLHKYLGFQQWRSCFCLFNQE